MECSNAPPLSSEDNKFCILAFYKFVSPIVEDDQVARWKETVEEFLRVTVQCDVRGLVLLSVEGINGTICFPHHAAERVETFFTNMFPGGLLTRRSTSKRSVFYRLNIKIRSENVTLGPVVHHNNDDAASPSYLRPYRTGEYVSPGKEWNDLLTDPDCLVIDTRNEYEVDIGTFEGSVQPHTSEFREFPEWLEQQLLEKKDRRPKKIAMFCTGGIRCEKSTALCLQMLAQEDKQEDDASSIPVYHLRGGILAYLDQVPASESLFRGECFVFDQRTAVSHGLQPSTSFVSCHACRRAVPKEDTRLSTYQEGVSCPRCFDERKERRQRYTDRQKQFATLEGEASANRAPKSI